MKTDKLYFGAAYYSEYLPYDRVEKDMEMMEKAGMNVIRIAESTWSTLEPQEGVYDFTHIDRMLDAAARHHISVIVGTPTYAVPTWLVKKYPDILAITQNGRERYGHRQNMDITNPDYLSHAERVIRVLMEHGVLALPLHLCFDTYPPARSAAAVPVDVRRAALRAAQAARPGHFRCPYRPCNSASVLLTDPKPY